MKRVTVGKSRARDIRPPGSVRAKAKWLSYSTVTLRRPPFGKLIVPPEDTT
jgi:hypothetical protein